MPATSFLALPPAAGMSQICWRPSSKAIVFESRDQSQLPPSASPRMTGLVAPPVAEMTSRSAFVGLVRCMKQSQRPLGDQDRQDMEKIGLRSALLLGGMR